MEDQNNIIDEHLGILHIGTKVVYTFWRMFLRQICSVNQSALSLCGCLKENYLIIWLKQESRDLFLLPHQRGVRSSPFVVSSLSIFP